MAARPTFGTIYRSPGYGADLKEFAPLVEQIGYDDIWFNETILGRGPYADTLACMAAAAGCTRHIRLGTAILLLPLHHPVLVAKAVGTIDVISGGRVTLGVGVGGEWTQSFEALGVRVGDRGGRTDESIGVIKKLWTGTRVSHDGPRFPFQDVELLPPPLQKPHPPIWIGGRPTSKDGTLYPSLRRTGRHGDGWLPYLVTPDMYREGWKKIQAYAGEAGRSIDDISPGLVLNLTIAGTSAEARRLAVAEHGRVYKQDFERLVDKYDIYGTPEDCIKGIERYIDAGARHIIFQWRCPMADSPANTKLAGEKILPYFRSN